MQGHRHDEVRGRQSPTGMSGFQQLDQGRRPSRLRPKLELVDTGPNDALVEYG